MIELCCDPFSASPAFLPFLPSFLVKQRNRQEEEYGIYSHIFFSEHSVSA